MYERHPEKELKEEAYAIFFKSLDDILETVGIGNRKVIMHLTWHYRTIKLPSYRIIDENIRKQLPIHKEEDEEEYKVYERNLNWYYLSFKFKGIKYRLGLTSRIGLIVDFLITKGIFEPFLEATKGYKYNPEHVRLKDGREMIPMNMTRYIEYWGQGMGRDIESMKERIWNPEVDKYEYDDGVKRIGDL